MKRILVILLCVLLSGIVSGQDAKTVIEKTLPSIVTIRCVDVLGYGFFIDKDLIVTNYQVINKARVGAAKATIGKSEVSVDIIGFVAADKENNLVLLKAKYTEGNQLKINDTPPAKEKAVFAYNCKNMQEMSVVKGNIGELKDYGTFQLLLINTGMTLSGSGLPILDENLNVVGVSIPPLGKDTNTNFAIPAQKVKELIANKTDYVQELKELLPPDKIEKEKEPQKSELVIQYLNQGNAKIYSKDYKGAVEKFTLAIKLTPLDADAYVFRGQAKYLLMEFKDALKDFDMAIDLQPSYAEAFDLRGIVKRELGDNDGACQDWQRSYELGFDNAFQLLKNFCDLEKMK
jgi:tetratricopeptide (TPR) repeat protein